MRSVRRRGAALLSRSCRTGQSRCRGIGTVPARGLTPKELENAINTGYKARNLNVFVNVLPRTLLAGSAYVLGEVGKPGRVELDRPRTVLMTLAQAGGVTTAGAMNAVRLLYVGDDGVPRIRSINLSNVLDSLNLEQDMIVPNNAIIYVPTSALAQTGRFMDLVLRDILRYGGFTIGGALLLNQNNQPPASHPGPMIASLQRLTAGASAVGRRMTREDRATGLLGFLRGKWSLHRSHNIY